MRFKWEKVCHYIALCRKLGLNLVNISNTITLDAQ